MQIQFKQIAVLAILAALRSPLQAQGLLPAPSPAGGGYFSQVGPPTGSAVGQSVMTATPASAAPAGKTPTVAWYSPETSGGSVQPASGVGCGCGISGITAGGGSCTDCGSMWAGACDQGCAGAIDSCDMPCDSGCGESGLWAHYTDVHASILYLRPRNADVAYGVPIDGPIVNAPANNPIQVGRVGVVDFDYETGFDVGFNLAVNAMTSVYANLLMFDSSATDSISTTAPDVIRSIVSHPSSTSAATDYLSGSANLDLDLDVVDVGLRHLFVGGRVYALNWFAGARYARLNQQFGANFIDNGTEDVVTDIDFDGAGVRLGLEAERQSCRSRLRVYSKASSSFLAGKFSASYFQGQSFDPSVVDTNWEAGRIVPVLDLEAGAGWTSKSGRLRLGVGYMVSAWFNTVQTEEFIQSVQQNSFIDLGSTLTFDGLRGTAELRF